MGSAWHESLFFHPSGIFHPQRGVVCPLLTEEHTLNREDWKGFYGWLDTASLAELNIRKGNIEDLLETLRDPDVRGEARRMCRKIEEEILLRLFRP